MPVRTFLALDLDDAILDRLESARRALDDGQSRVNWVERENLHVTLCFLGDVPDELLADVCRIAEGAAGEVEAFEFDVRGLRPVPPHAAPRMIWADVRDPTGRLVLLQEKLADALVGLRLRQEERAYKPHITLARVKFASDPHGLRRAAEAMADEDFGVQHAEEVVAYASHLTPEGPVYSAIARAGLGK
jgi:2'-5' RNA ligase